MLETRSNTVPSVRTHELLTGIPEGALFHVERPAAGGVATLVTVVPHWDDRN